MGDTVNRAYEEKLKIFQREIINICLDTVGTEVDTICAYCSTVKNACSFNLTFRCAEFFVQRNLSLYWSSQKI